MLCNCLLFKNALPIPLGNTQKYLSSIKVQQLAEIKVFKKQTFVCISASLFFSMVYEAFSLVPLELATNVLSETNL